MRFFLEGHVRAAHLLIHAPKTHVSYGIWVIVTSAEGATFGYLGCPVNPSIIAKSTLEQQKRGDD